MYQRVKREIVHQRTTQVVPADQRKDSRGNNGWYIEIEGRKKEQDIVATKKLGKG